MTGRQHAAIGLGTVLPVGVALALGTAPGPPPVPEWLAAAGPGPRGAALVALLVGGGLLGALLPDLDSEHSLLEAAPRRVLYRLRRRGGVLWLLLAPVLIVLSAALWLTNEAIMLVSDHRGITHSLVALILVTAGCWLLTDWAVGPALAIGLGLGYASHLAADAMTPRGVSLGAPFSRRPFHLLPGPLRFSGDSRPAAWLAVLMLLGGVGASAWRLWLLLR
jgi:membrane-bound metal-dependent hydrolase YbcI (DUF457 family)